MFRLIALRNAPKGLAFSAFTGNLYPAALGEKLAGLGFTSDLWLTEKQMKAFGVSVKPDQVAKGFESETPDGYKFKLYNADQTTDAAKVAASKGKAAVTKALTKERFRGGAETTLLEAFAQGKFAKNEWIVDKDIDALGLKIKAGAAPTVVSYTFEDVTAQNDGSSTKESRIVTQGFYNVEQLDEPAVIARAQKIFPISASSGRKYKGQTALTLLRAALVNNYDSPYWITMQGAQALGLHVKDATKGVDITVGEGKVLTFFNGAQTSNPGKVASAAYKATFNPRSAVSGSSYPEPTATTLSTEGAKRKYRSIYWLTERQCAFVGVSIKDGEVPVEVQMPEGSLKLFNAEQTTSKAAIEARHGKKH